ncbi:opioid-binding protein/cell adhesion molecule homolog isoform X1 [Haliotis rubra]|uniref:opioid-binding protein/cell adhesion molecule homolog isoform X1 n=1 Tax=Haliotis rubra TaxID=36100 RepID=UPI001EE4F613|nr:opioid-binding protein/cell adhesion molecule homolog isoform X1 [Haliotis rubra]
MWIVVVAVVAYVKVSLAAQDPTFETPVVNVTVVEGATAVLPCKVSHLGRHKVAWTDQWSTLLAFMDTRIIDDERISVDRPYGNDWNLHISGVKLDDQGIYNCQINTKPVKIQTVVLNILVPPRILGAQSDTEVVVNEGLSVSLSCNVSGIPRPTVMWYKKPTQPGQSKDSEFCPATARIGFSGEVLMIHNVTRHCGGKYECVADNGVPPAVKRQINVGVKFPPEIHIHNKRIGQVRGKDTILECVVTAHPQGVSVWKFENRQLPKALQKYRVEVFEEGSHTITLSLRISKLNEHDYGEYTCVASNSMGSDSKRTLLYEHIIPTKPPTTTTTTTRATTTSLRPTQGKTDQIPGYDYPSENGPPEYIPRPTLKKVHPLLPGGKNDPIVVGSAGSKGPESGARKNSVFSTVLLMCIFSLLNPL